MYLDLGEHTAILQKDIIGVFDMDATTVSKKTREFLNHQQQKEKLVCVSEDLPLAFVVCKNKTYTCCIRPQTLAARGSSGLF